MKTNNKKYYIPKPSHWPLTGSIALFFLLAGAANWLHHKTFGPYLFMIGALLLTYMMFGWFGAVIRENRAGLLSGQRVDYSYRWAMVWFIFTEVMFFAAFFGALFYARTFSVPWLSGSGDGVMTHLLLWPGFQGGWPALSNPNPNAFTAPRGVMETWGIPAINTAILLTSAGTVTVAHWALLKKNRAMMITAQTVTILLGFIFLGMQAHEYLLAYTEYGLTLASGIYGATFFMLTGFHAAHVTIGTIALIVIWYRMLKNDFSPTNHFGFEAVSWYWHFVDVVWLMLFILVYWL